MRAGIGIDIGGTKMLGLILCENNELESELVLKTAASLGYESLIVRIKQLIHSLIDSSPHTIVSIGLALAGAVEAGRRIPFCPNLPLKNIELASLIEEEFGLPCVLSNDVNAALFAECRLNKQITQGQLGKQVQQNSKKPKGAELGIFVGTGVGGAILLDGGLYAGRGGAGEFGHMRLAENGKLCGCGNRGCLEAYASKTAIQNYIKEELKKGRSSILAEGFEREAEGGMLRKGALLAAYHKGDEIALEALSTSRRALGVALVNLVNIFHPSAIVLGGGIMEDFYEYYKPYLIDYIKNEAYSGFAEELEIRRALLGARGGALGAALLAREGLKYE